MAKVKEKKKAITHFRDLDCWKDAVRLMHVFYAVTEKFPEEDEAETGNYIRNFSISIPAHIAAAFKAKDKENALHVIDLALIDLASLQKLLIMSCERGYVHPKVLTQLLEDSDDLDVAINEYRNEIRKKIYIIEE